ncbi:glucose-6-phosphate 1-dehydrogenase [Thiorhodococcus drewsii AZ1]|uniref:Glucose-6-phosphate 1-dehydrogenase n=1 Tax=Thiorhodococcus drewsii AZ1 TaxID=765913 RepID=G2DXC5_9GAMM|nr:glucose-6-phosphate dehydrogenase [Thiorhodococcus drewsii]EGV33479.1 glucose-6-phosphate 1-dehydrogenase [Thiorhodococcus drewsii AZ1]
MTETNADANPLMTDRSEEFFPQACTIVIFGGAGDLSKRKLIPALYNLALDGLLPTQFAVIGFAIDAMSDEAFREFARDGIERFSRRQLDEEEWREFSEHLFYRQGDFGDAAAYAALKARAEEIEPHFGIGGSRIFYLAIPPSFIETCVFGLREAGLVAPADQDLPFTRLIVEKPIGRDLESARGVNRALQACFAEHQLYRIDHYLGKETVQNILAMRFGNAIFEPLWNSKHIDHVQITVAEAEGVGTRAGYFETAGALRDMVQNHILQLLSLVAMEPPWSMRADVIRDRRLDLLQCLRPMRRHEVDQHVVRAQYASGFFLGKNAPGYRREEGVASDSTTETFVALRLFIDNWRWAGVPIYIRTGKAMPKRVSEVAVQFKAVPHMLFNTDTDHPLEPNVLALRIQPDEGLALRIGTKLPGPKVKIYPVKMDFRYGSTFGDQSPEAYERLLLDVMAGDATLFMRDDAVEASWQWIQPILDAWASSGERWLPEYPAGSWGPIEADRLIHADGYDWRRL